MSYDTPSPEVETTTGSSKPESQTPAPATPEEVDPKDGTDETGTPVDNPAG